MHANGCSIELDTWRSMNHAWRRFRNSRIKTHASLMYIYMCETRKGKILGQRFLPRTHFRHIYTPRARHETVSRLSSAPQPPIYTYIYIFIYIYIYSTSHMECVCPCACMSLCAHVYNCFWRTPKAPASARNFLKPVLGPIF